MTIARRTLAVATTAIFLALAGSTAALAANDRADASQRTQAVAAFCDDLAARIAQLQTTRGSLVAAAAQVQQRIAAGGLAPRQLFIARAELAILRLRLVLLDATLGFLQQRQAQLCPGGGAGTPPPPTTPPPTTPPPTTPPPTTPPPPSGE